MPSVIKNVGPKLIPFLKTIVIYFVLFFPDTNPGFLPALLKCLPIISLMVFVGWYGKNMKDLDKTFAKGIFFGLFFSCIGDFCLIWPGLFPLGMLSFAIGHVFYIRAFGMEPLNLPLAVVLYTITILGCIYISLDLSGILLPGVPIYTLVLTTMMWRALARLEFKKKQYSIFKLCTAIGSISFVVSDLLIALNMFKFAIPYNQLFIMSTYYLAQFGIALSIVDVDRHGKQN